MANDTLRAHCGACAGPMIMAQIGDTLFWFVCVDCGAETDRRSTAAAAAEDVVWVPTKTRRSQLLADKPA